MAIQGASGPGTGIPVTFRQLNVEATKYGENATAARMHAAKPEVSNTGATTNIGTSKFQETNNEAIEVATEKMAEIMQKDDEYTKISATDARFSPTGVLESNNLSVERQQQISAAAQAYSYFK